MNFKRFRVFLLASFFLLFAGCIPSVSSVVTGTVPDWVVTVRAGVSGFALAGVVIDAEGVASNDSRCFVISVRKIGCDVGSLPSLGVTVVEFTATGVPDCIATGYVGRSPVTDYRPVPCEVRATVGL